MQDIHPRFITDQAGNKLSVVLSINEYNKLIEDAEELEDIELIEKSKADNEPPIPIDEAFKMIEAERKKRK